MRGAKTGRAVLAVALAACGGVPVHEGLERGPNPGLPGWPSCRQALDLGLTGDACAFEGWCGLLPGAGSGPGRAAACLGTVLVTQTLVAGAGTMACGVQDPLTGAWTPEPQGHCLRVPEQACGATTPGEGAAHLGCVDPPLAPRTLPQAWDLGTGAACQAALAQQPWNGDPCSGAAACTGPWVGSPGPRPPAEPVALWCDAGAVRVALLLPGAW